MTENKSTVCLITNVQGYTLLVFKDCHGYQVDAIAQERRSLLWGAKSITALRVLKQKEGSGWRNSGTRRMRSGEPRTTKARNMYFFG